MEFDYLGINQNEYGEFSTEFIITPTYYKHSYFAYKWNDMKNARTVW